MSNLSFNFSESPFEAIKRIENGIEVWYARELMPLLGYKAWRRFNDVIQNALENVETIMGSALEHFLPVESKSQGRPGLDYKLSRLACYHIALCCDSRGNDAVKMAKHYFAVKTRQAETGQAFIGELQTLPASPESKAKSAMEIIELVFKDVKIKPELVAGVKLNAAKMLVPDLELALEQSRQLLIVNTAQPEKLMTPTDIGKVLGISGQAVNKLLVANGLQTPNQNRKSRKEPAYLPTAKGKEYSDLTLATGSNSSATYQQLRWYESVIDVIR